MNFEKIPSNGDSDKKDPLMQQYEEIQQALGTAKTLEDLAEIKRKSLVFEDINEWTVETAQDIRKKFDELLA